MTVQLGLDQCRILRPIHARDGVEITLAPAAARQFPTRLSETLGVVAKAGPDHLVTADGRKRCYPRDGVCVRPPGCVLSSETSTSAFVSIDIAVARLGETDICGTMAFFPPTGLPDIPRLARSLVDADSVLDADQLIARLVGVVVASGVVSSQAVDAQARDARSLMRAREFLSSDLSGQPTLEQAARAAGVTTFGLLRAFKRALNTTPHAYLVMLRLEAARRALARGASVSESALDAGFSDQSHLTRWFRRAHGITPGSYARSMRSVHAAPLSISFKTT